MQGSGIRIAALILTALLTGCDQDGNGAAAQPGEEIYNRFCFSCHAAGVAGAPVPGDREAWAPRVAKGREALVRSVREGMPPGMPAGGLCTGCSDADLAAAVDYMLSQLP